MAENGKNWSQRTDEELALVLKSDEKAAVNDAMAELQRRHRRRLERYMRDKLPAAYVEDAIQETWMGFYQAARRDKAIRNARGLLRTIAKRRRVDAVRKVKAEREIEFDLQPDDDEGEYDDETERYAAELSIEEFLDARDISIRVEQLLNTLPHYPFTDAVLSACQRVVWVMRENYDYPSKVVARLMGKKDTNIRVQVNKARRRVADYFTGEDFELTLANQEMPHIWSPPSIPQQATLIEHFAERALPQLMPDELAPLGLTNQDLDEGYVVSVMMPRWFEAERGQEMTPPYLVLTRKSEWDEMESLVARLAKDPEDLPEEFPEQALIEVHVEDGNIVLRAAPIHQMVPDDPDYPVYPDTYLSVHSPRVRVPVILAPYSESLYTPDLLARWPFVQEKDATGEGREIYHVEDGQIVGKSRPG